MPTVSQPQTFGSLTGLIRIVQRNWHLTWALAKREITDRYAGQMLGLLWTVGHPLLLMAVYIFIFGTVFRVRVGGTVDLPMGYTAYILSGLIPWLAVNESLNKGCTIITGNSNLVKQVVFPLEILPIKAVMASFFSQFISFGLLIVYILATVHYLPWTFLLLPVLIVLQFLFITGLAFALASIAPFFRDLKDFVQLYCVIGIYIIPVVYLPSMVPKLFHPFLYANPFSYLVWTFQDVCYFGRIEHPFAWAVLTVMSFVTLIAGYRMFTKLKPYFGNVL